MNKAIFIDKDGTLIPDIPYNTNPDLISLYDKSIDGLQRLRNADYLFVVISNQSGIAFDFFTDKELKMVEVKVRQLLNDVGIDLQGFYHCPHHPDGKNKKYAIDCNCRKPKAGMLFKAAADLKIDLKKSWMIGDILNDVEAGNRAGCFSVLIDNGGETEWATGTHRNPDLKARNLNEAADLIIKFDHERGLGGM